MDHVAIDLGSRRVPKVDRCKSLGYRAAFLSVVQLSVRVASDGPHGGYRMP